MIDANNKAHMICVESCLDRQKHAATLSDGCEETYVELIECIAALKCDGNLAWRHRKEDPGEPCPCQQKTEAFTGECPGILP